MSHRDIPTIGRYYPGAGFQGISKIQLKPDTTRGYGQVWATRLTTATLRPSAPPAPISIPLTDMRWPTNESSLVRTNLREMVRVPSATVASSGVAAVLSVRTGAVALVSVQSLPFFARQPTTRTRVFAGSSPGPSFETIWTPTIDAGVSSVVPAGKPLDLRINATRSL